MKEQVNQREIPFLTHFTRAENLRSIIQHGLYTPNQLTQLSISTTLNRLKSVSAPVIGANSVSLSVSTVNAELLRNYRNQLINADSTWVILTLSPDLLWEKECAFYFTSMIHDHFKGQEEQLRLPTAFEHLFLDLDQFLPIKELLNFKRLESRANQGLKAYEPTDKRAEVLVYEGVDAKYIQGFHFASQEEYEPYKNLLKELAPALHVEYSKSPLFVEVALKSNH